MLVLKKIYPSIGNVKKLQILDTESGKKYDALSNLLEGLSVFGIIDNRYYVEISDLAWKFLDLIDSPEESEPVKLDDYKVVSDRCMTCGKDVYVYCISSVIPLDENKIFWGRDSKATTIFNIYKYCFKQSIRYTSDMNLYIIFSSECRAYRLDINDKAIRFMEKAIVLERD